MIVSGGVHGQIEAEAGFSKGYWLIGCNPLAGGSVMKGESLRRVSLTSALGLILCVALAAGCADDDKNDYRLEEIETRTWPAAGINEIVGITVNGNVGVEASQDTVITCVITRRCYGKDRADAENYIGNVVVEDSLAGGILTITADMPESSDRNYGADLEIFATEAVHLDLTTVNGNAQAVNTVGGAELTTTNGNTTSENLEGGLSSLIVNGDATCDLALLATGESAVLVTTNGNVVLSVPSDVSASFNAQTTNGSVRVSGFASVSYSVDEPNHKSGTIGSLPSLATITITIVNGDATIEAR
jgi:hypothetical protein